MNAYVITTGAIFGMIVIAHILRIIEEGTQLARDPWYIALTLVAAGLCAWAGHLLWRTRVRKKR